MDTSLRNQWWLAEIDQHGNAKLTDGSHGSKDGVEQALYLTQRLGFAKGKRFAAAYVELSEVEAKPHDANEDALNTLNSIGLKP